MTLLPERERDVFNNQGLCTPQPLNLIELIKDSILESLRLSLSSF